MPFYEIIFLIFTLTSTAGFFYFSLVSLREKHHRAARISAAFGLLGILLIAVFLLSPPTIKITFSVLVGVGVIAMVILFILPTRQSISPSAPPKGQVDERTIIFARAQLEPGTRAYETYYQDHPEHKALDDAFRQNPGLLEPGALFYDPLLASSPEGGFFLTEALRDAVDGPVTGKRTAQSPERLTRFVKDLAAYHGAVDTGVCELKSCHIYSHIGRGTGTYGAPVTLHHKYAIALTVEMAHEMINSAPRMPAVIESARQYAEAGKIAVILAAAIRSLGYPARAHIDGNYRVIAPLVAKDAGLGEIGRMGLLMTPKLGPRVRLAVVTTDLPLIIDTPTWDPTVIDFCSICNKCAAACPSQAIPFGDRTQYEDGTLRWKIDPERCYTYWTKIGTDCGRCMAVCPYAHADNFLHNLIRLGVKHSNGFRRAASAMDDLFYGKKPIPHAPPEWVQDVKKER